MRRVLSDLDPHGYEDSPLDSGNKWDTRVHDMEDLWETPLFRHLRKWADYHSAFVEKPQRVKARRESEREPSQEVW